MRLGKYSWDKPVFLAPMAGVTDKAFRETVRAVGGEYVWSEMISDKALTYQNSRTLHMLALDGEAEPRIVQLFGTEPDTMARAAYMVEERGGTVIDINMGCPTPKIVKNGEGAALLKDISLAGEIVRAVVKAVSIPVTVKIRLGWSDNEIVAIEIAKRLEEAGAQMLTLHARTREQFYAGKANWEWISKVKGQISIPLIGNGDILKPEDGLAMISQTQCDGVMIGRGAMGNPWLIPRAQHYLRTGVIKPEPGITEKIAVAQGHFDRLLSYKGDRIGLNEMRKHAVWYIKGIKNAAVFRDQIMQTESPAEMKEIFCRILMENG